MKEFGVFLLLIFGAVGDIYMHHPRGSNDRNRERNGNRNNGNRIYDSQNNGAGGYPYCGNATVVDDTDGLVLYEGSVLRIEWTLQHSCGPDANAFCSVVLQYGCSDTMPLIRDGYPSDPDLVQNQVEGYYRAQFRDNNADGTNRIPIPSSVRGGQGNFGDSLDTNEEQYLAFYEGNVVTNDNGDNRYPLEYGYHESFEYYRDQCYMTSRNYGLYTADQTLSNFRAVNTRQNPNGGRDGFECPEERDYYPWWQPTPWKDIAVLVTDTAWCEYYQTESFNVKSRYVCVMTEAERENAPNGLYPIFEDECFAFSGVWTEVEAHGIDAPDCQLHAFSRDNHLGNVVSVNDNGEITGDRPHMAYYDWTIPADAVDKECVVRVRYNMSSSDYNAMNTFRVDYDPEEHGVMFDWKYNCEAVTFNGDVDDATFTIDADQVTQCDGLLTESVVPLYNRPYVSVFSGMPALAIAFNTNQVGRTFQDRSYVLRIRERPDGIPDSAVIWNLGYRGRRGNIVQAYPAVEYDFVPSNLSISENDYVHIQFCGSDFTENRQPNNGEGWRHSDRTNMIQTNNLQTQFPAAYSQQNMFSSEDVAINMAYAGIDFETAECLEFPNEDEDDDDSVHNCGKLNPAPARFDGGIHQFSAGTYNYVSTRNNNFSNRGQKGTLMVRGALSTAETVGIAVAVVVGVGAAFAGLCYYGKKRPDSALGRVLNKGSTPQGERY